MVVNEATITIWVSVMRVHHGVASCACQWEAGARQRVGAGRGRRRRRRLAAAGWLRCGNAVPRASPARPAYRLGHGHVR